MLLHQRQVRRRAGHEDFIALGAVAHRQLLAEYVEGIEIGLQLVEVQRTGLEQFGADLVAAVEVQKVAVEVPGEAVGAAQRLQKFTGGGGAKSAAGLAAHLLREHHRHVQVVAEFFQRAAHILIDQHVGIGCGKPFRLFASVGKTGAEQP